VHCARRLARNPRETPRVKIRPPTQCDVTGTLVGFRCPPFVAGLNVAGDHLHFLTSDRTGGGHVLEMVIEDAVLTIDVTPAFLLSLPLGDSTFYMLDLSSDTQDATERVEKP
jgi:acetolactate decarboxylase